MRGEVPRSERSLPYLCLRDDELDEPSVEADGWLERAETEPPADRNMGAAECLG